MSGFQLYFPDYDRDPRINPLTSVNLLRELAVKHLRDRYT